MLCAYFYFIISSCSELSRNKRVIPHTAARPTVDSSDGWWTERADAFTLINLQARGRINLAALVEEVHSYTEGPEVFGRLATEKNFPIVQFDWEK